MPKAKEPKQEEPKGHNVIHIEVDDGKERPAPEHKVIKATKKGDTE